MRVGGRVKFFDRLKGWGMITPDAGGEDVFVHYKAIEGSGYRNLYEGERVTFVEIDNGRGPQAQKVERTR